MRADVRDAAADRGLRAVAVMVVEVEHDDALALALRVRARGDRGVVEHAKAHAARRLGVVTGRAHEREGAAPPVDRRFQRDERRADGARRAFVRTGVDRRVAGDQIGTSPGSSASHVRRTSSMYAAGCTRAISSGRATRVSTRSPSIPRRCSSAATTRTRSGISGCGTPLRCAVRAFVVRDEHRSTRRGASALVFGGRSSSAASSRPASAAVDRRDQRLHFVGRLRSRLDVCRAASGTPPSPCRAACAPA